tara:strand:+ start:236 stop:475 length:240 start_codon:yes stop_codon:yes gene_type:complete
VRDNKSTRTIERLVGLMEKGRVYSPRELHDIACRELSRNYQPVNTTSTARRLAMAARYGLVRRLDTYEFRGPVHYEVIA